MTAPNPAQEERAKLNFDFDDEPALSQEATHQKVQEINEKAGWTARAPRRAKEQDVPKNPDDMKERRPGRRQKTGRTLSFNTKIKPETYEQLCSLADKATDKEGRPVSFAEIIERGLESLQRTELENKGREGD
jgi:hypothetical protein